MPGSLRQKSLLSQDGEDPESGGSAVLRDIQDPHNRQFLYFTLIVLWLSRLCFQLYAAPLQDEAYYWLWGVHLSLSYYDHPPLHAWLQGVDARIFGWSRVALRLLTWPTTIGTIALLLWWSRQLAAPFWNSYALATVALYFASPLVSIYTTIVYPDHLLIFLSILSVSFFATFFIEFAAHKQQLIRYLYLGAFGLGLAALAKYNAIFLGLGVASTVIAQRKLRPLLRSPHLYAAAILTGILQLPVFYWNATNGLSSFRYNLWDRLHPQGWMVGLSTIAAFIGVSILVFSPFILPAFARFLSVRANGTAAAIRQSFGAWTFLWSTLFFLFLCFFVYTHFYWNMEAYLMFFPLALAYLNSARWLRAHLVYGMVCSVLFTINYTVLPLATVVGRTDFESSRAFGWTEIGSQVAAAKTAYSARFVASSDWQAASQLAFALRDPTVECFDDNESQFMFWSERAQWRGQDAIILVDELKIQAVDYIIRPQFRTLELITTIPVVRFGRTLTTYQLYRGVSYIGKTS
jgi:4-amino-4-deoxy-L-arabinose transferase-like glycosyltransferase